MLKQFIFHTRQKSPKNQKRQLLKQINNALSLVLFCLCLYLISAPLLPQLSFRTKSGEGGSFAAGQAERENREVMPEKNLLVVPRLNLEQEIYESNDGSALKKGVWRRPQAGVPGAENTVLVGHRFTYAGPAVFYHLDKLQKGDELVVYWHQQKFEYIVQNTLIVAPSAIEIEQKDVGEERLTLYTCTPLWTATHRLVIQAKPFEEQT